MKDLIKLLEENKLAHFQFDEENSRLLYTHEIGTPIHKDDFQRLIQLLKKNEIKHDDIGMDVILIQRD
ncbi:hypothetical protein [Sulfurimonas sp. HSL-1716]|uniref:hypothetical protein n=1 Tax=Hydrocurvibacter sulfurireducens TaxID=3131937 RepID=UPI0031F75E97